MKEINKLTFVCLLFLVAIITASAVIEFKEITIFECHQERHPDLDECIKEQMN